MTQQELQTKTNLSIITHIKAGNLIEVRKLLAGKEFIDGQDVDLKPEFKADQSHGFYGPYKLACKIGQLEIVKYLVTGEYHSPIGIIKDDIKLMQYYDNEQDPGILLALQYKHTEVVDYLIDLHPSTFYNINEIIEFATSRELEKVKDFNQLFEGIISKRRFDLYQNYILDRKELLAVEFELNFKIACQYGAVEVIEYLVPIIKKIDIDQKIILNGLLLSIDHEQLKVFKLIYSYITFSKIIVEAQIIQKVLEKTDISEEFLKILLDDYTFNFKDIVDIGRERNQSLLKLLFKDKIKYNLTQEEKQKLCGYFLSPYYFDNAFVISDYFNIPHNKEDIKYFIDRFSKDSRLDNKTLNNINIFMKKYPEKASEIIRTNSKIYAEDIFYFYNEKKLHIFMDVLQDDTLIKEIKKCTVSACEAYFEKFEDSNNDYGDPKKHIKRLKDNREDIINQLEKQQLNFRLNKELSESKNINLIKI
ncbi:MAG: hypothetical protein H7263_10665 [Candidatus Sericytochromatia bacterium]|nr:hypothetical protein [Candidatus Sericytochromatia bacterium]